MSRGAPGPAAGGWKLLLASLALSLVVGGALAEAWLRWSDFSYYWALARWPDAERGWMPMPGATAWQRLEGEALVAINDRGRRDVDHPLEPPPGTLRVAVLGDSFTAAVQVPREAAWWHRMQERLAGCEAAGGRDPQVLNFGVSGYGTAQQLLTWRHHAAAYRAEVVVLGFFPGNDLVENEPELDGAPPTRPYFRLEDGRLAADTRFRERLGFRLASSGPGRALYRLRGHSRLLQAGVRAAHLVGLTGGDGAARAAGGGPREPGVDNRIYAPPAEPAWERAWAVTEAMLARLGEEVRAGGAIPVVLSFSTGAQVHPDPAFRAAYARALGVEDLHYPGRRLEALAGDGLVVRDLAPDLAWMASWSGAWLHGFPPQPGTGHWNTDGHRAAGDLAAATVCRAMGNPGTVY